MPVLRGDHRIDVVHDSRIGRRSKVPSREDSRECIDNALVIRRNGLSILTQHRRSIFVESVQSDGEQLQDFTRVIFVGIRSIVSRHIQVVTHRWIKRDLIQQLTVVAESVAIENLEVRRHAAGMRDIDAGHHNNLMQRKGHTLAQLIGTIERVCVEPCLDRIKRVIVAPARCIAIGWYRRRHKRQGWITRERS